MKKGEVSLRKMWDTMRHSNIRVMGSAGRRGEKKQNIFEKIVASKPSKFTENTIYVSRKFNKSQTV